MRLQCQRPSDFRSQMVAAERLKAVLLLDANPGAAHAHPQPAQVEGRSHGTRTALLPAREVRSALRRRQVERLLPVLRLPVNQSRMRFQPEPSPQLAVGLRSRAAALRSAWADCLSPVVENPVVADSRI